ncbi:Raffinose synthase family protein [Euphorbia peplus]|nr:Raffinose synthase family protein [Euphorbia peplus]
MAPTKNFTHPVAPADDKPPNISLSLKKTTFLANGHPILHQVPPNITLTPSVPHSNSTGAGCFMGFTAHEPSSRHVTPVGKLKGIKFMSIFRFKVWWSTLLLGLNGKDVELEIQIMILSNDDDLGRPYVLLLPIIEGTFRSSLQAGVHNDDYLDICVESGSTRVSESRFTSCLYVHADHDPYRLVKDTMRVVRFHLNTFKLLEEKKPPEIIDKFGWCTWDAVYYKVDTQSIRNGIKSLVEGGCPPNWIIIDDGWQCIWHDDQELDMEGMERMVAGMLMPRESPRLKSFEVNEKFRNYKSCRGDSDKAGMGAFIRDVKDEFKTLNHVYVWHAFLGYWGGIRPNTSGMPSSKLIAPKLSHALGKTMDDLAINQLHSYGIGFVEPERAGELYDGLHSYLASVGIDGVKIDVTHLLEMVSEEYGGTVEVGKAYYKALSDSITNYFNGNGAIASMEQGNDFMFLGTEVISLGRAGDFLGG